MIISVEFKNGVAEVKVISPMKDSELKELPHFAQAILSTKWYSDDITKIFELVKAFTKDVLGKDDAEDNGCIDDNNAYYKNDIDTKNIIDTDTQTVLENKHNIVDTIISLYKECENAKRRYKKYSQMLSILKDIRADEYISCDDRVLIDVKIKVCEEKTDCLRTAYEKLMKAISEV